MIQEVRVTNRSGVGDPAGNGLLYDIKTFLGIKSITGVRTAKIYRFENISEKQAGLLAQKLLAEEVFQLHSLNAPILQGAQKIVEVAYKPGVMNPEAASLLKAAADLEVYADAADSSREYAFYGEKIREKDIQTIIDHLLVNTTVERVVGKAPLSLIIRGNPTSSETIPIAQMDDIQLMELSSEKLFLNLEEMRLIQSYFKKAGRNPTDCEIETIAQTWSEHCSHKTFKAKLIVNGEEKTPLLKRLQQATSESRHPLVLSAFVDNSGVMDFYNGWAICGKVETHNSPSAIEPYGGAMTGSGGVFRDVLGTGQGAKVIASTDIFCFAHPDTPREEIPPGCLHPHYLLSRVVAGVRDYGNRMGIPTNNGSVHFHRDFRAKPTIIVGAYGILPKERCAKGQPQIGDLVLAIGGRTGRDGIHGATFSSGEMTARTTEVNSSAVQIGHPIEEKRVSDAIIKASLAGLIRAVTDCGAGGFSSAIGEMGSETGVEVALEKAPLKYPGLKPWEIWVSESQERMVLAIAPENLDSVLEICNLLNVEASVLGQFKDSKKLVVTYRGETICDLQMSFLHHGLPQRVMKASSKKKEYGDDKNIPLPADWPLVYQRIMSHPNICSKEPIVRMYDHGVQGTCCLPPFSGIAGDCPNDSVVLKPLLDYPYGMVISHGLNPVLNTMDPYYGSLWAAAEAVSNAVAVGANPEELVLIDNFIWPFPDEESLGDLDRAVDACVDFVHATGMPFISGKDSLSSTYRGIDGTLLKIPPVLCVSAFGRIADVQKTVSSDFKRPGSSIILVGKRELEQMGGSVYYELEGLEGPLPVIDLNILSLTFKKIHQAISSGQILSCHDISEGGVAVALAEMCFGGGMGANITLKEEIRPDYFLFNETAGCFLVETDPETDYNAIFSGVPHVKIGNTTSEREISLFAGSNKLFRLDQGLLIEPWKGLMQKVFNA
jgi:phosphoribosylformylglycinamidine synthase